MSIHFQRLEKAAREVASRRANASSDQIAARMRVKQWQARRLAREHAPLLESSRYQAAARFFLDDLYGAKDFTQRDAEIQKVLPTLKRFLPDAAIAAIADAVELDALSELLDADLTQRICALLAFPGDEITESIYARAYRNQSVAMGSPDLREHQIDLVNRIGKQLDVLVKQPLLGGLLKSMKMPAKAVGLSALYEFLLRGFVAFKSMQGAAEFLDRINALERSKHRELLQK